MAFHTRKDFCLLCGIDPRHLATYVKRGKVAIDANGLIDDTNGINHLFIKKKTGKSKKGKEQVTPEPQAPELKPSKANELVELEQRKKELDVEKTTREIEILNQKRDKMRGMVLPMDILKPALAQHFKDITVSMNNGIDDIVTYVVKKARLNVNEAAEIRMQIGHILNIAVNNSIDATNRSILNISKEFSEVARA